MNIDANDPKWTNFIKDQLAKAGFDKSNPIPFYRSTVPGERLDPTKPKPSIFMPVTKPTKEFVEEHLLFGRYDAQRTAEIQAKLIKADILTLEHKEGLPSNNGVFHTECFHIRNHFGLYSSGLIADEMIDKEFAISSRFTAARDNRPEDEEKLAEIANILKNSAERAGIDIEHIGSKQWAAILRNSSSVIVGSVRLPNYQMSLVAGITANYFPGDKAEPFVALHSIASQTNVRPVAYDIHGEPPAIHLEVLER